MGAVAHLLLPIIPSAFFCLLITLILTLNIIFYSYKTIVKILKYFCIALGFYLIGSNKKLHQAPVFYVFITISLGLALAINWLGLSPMKALIWTAYCMG